MTWVTLGVSVGGAVLGGSQAKKAKKAQDKVAAEEEYYQQARQNKIGLVQGQVDAAYNNPARQQQYNTFASALRGFYGQALDKKKSRGEQRAQVRARQARADRLERRGHGTAQARRGAQ